MRVGKKFDVTIRGYAWQACDTQNSVDGTIEIVAQPVASDGRGVIGLVHGHLTRLNPGGPFVVNFRKDQIKDLIESANPEDNLPPHLVFDLLDDLQTLRIIDAGWRMNPYPIPQTRAARHAGAEMEFLETHLHLGSARWMQDWPNEVSNLERVEEFCAFYDMQADPGVRFDTMALALTSFDDKVRSDDEFDPDLTRWFEQTLRRDFALHGHTVGRWAMLDRDRDDSEFQLTYPEFVFRISGMMRRIWEESLVPIDVKWVPLN